MNIYDEFFLDEDEEAARKTYVRLIIGDTTNSSDVFDKCDKVFGSLKESDPDEYLALVRTVATLTADTNYPGEEQREFNDWRKT